MCVTMKDKKLCKSQNEGKTKNFEFLCKIYLKMMYIINSQHKNIDTIQFIYLGLKPKCTSVHGVCHTFIQQTFSAEKDPTKQFFRNLLLRGKL